MDNTAIREQETNLIDLFRKLNTEGQEVALDYLDTMIGSGLYNKNVIRVKWWKSEHDRH